MKPNFQDDTNTFYKGDCLEVIQKLEDRSIDMIVSDPPYYTPAKISATRKDFRRSLGNYGILDSWFRGVLSFAFQKIKETGHIYLFCDGRTYPMLWVQTYADTKDNRVLVWDKGRSINGYTWRKQHELILFAEMPDAKPVKTGDGDVIKMNAVPVQDRKHPAEKPVELIKKLIEKSTKEGDTVLDFTMGSGTTAIACLQTGRKCIGIEFSEEYYDIAVERYLKEKGQTKLI